MGWLEGDVALVTGAGSGLGRALVDRFVAEGARVVAFDRAPDRIAAVEADHGDAVAGVAGDVTVAEDNQRAVAGALEAFGRLDTFVGNAGMFDYGAGVRDTPVEQLSHAASTSCSPSTSRGTCSGSRRRWTSSPRAPAR